MWTNQKAKSVETIPSNHPHPHPHHEDMDKMACSTALRFSLFSKRARTNPFISWPLKEANFLWGSHSTMSLRLNSNKSVSAANLLHDGHTVCRASGPRNSTGSTNLSQNLNLVYWRPVDNNTWRTWFSALPWRCGWFQYQPPPKCNLRATAAPSAAPIRPPTSDP